MSFDRLVEAAIASLPPQYARWIEEVPVIVEDRPSASDHPHDAEGDPLGLFVGPSLADDPAGLPARIMLYREPLMAACSTREQLAGELRKTLMHELGHYTGMDEGDLERHGMGDMEDDDIEWNVEE